jgi:predicted amidohydrolase
MSHFSIAGMQLALPYGDNLEAIGVEISKTKQRFPWVDMIVLSELCSYGPQKQYAESLPGKAEEFYCHLAEKLNLWLIPGSQYEQVGDEIYNTATVINPRGKIIERYRKIYPFYPYEQGITPGDQFVVFDVPQGRIGVAICYDLWFPEMARALTCQGAEVLLYPTLTGTIDRPLELIMAQSTAACQQSYVFSINAGGEMGNGQSIVVGPQGNVICQAGIGSEVLPVEIDFALVRRTRERGIMGLGQPLKSFRDNTVVFPQYQKQYQQEKNSHQSGIEAFKALDTLGPLVVPNKKTN